jgi:glycosyltransferase involved in cell wall biosynthesis
VSQKTISIITPCYNEEANVLNLYNQVREVMAALPYAYEHIFIDNHSRDNTVPILKMIAAEDPNVKVIVNARNFGHIRSPMHAFLNTRGDAVIGIVADLQDPPPMIADMIREWELGAFCVLGIKRTSEEHSVMFWARKQYYRLAERLSSIETIQNFTGFGLYDRKVVELVRSFDDPYPYFRGMIAEIGLPTVKLLYDQPARKFGITKNNWYTLYDIGMLGIINHSKVPLRLATFAGFAGAALSFLVALGYLLAKLLFWSDFDLGVAPLLIGVFFVLSIVLVCLGIMGEYVGAIYTQLQHRPYAVELERLNFDQTFGPAKPTPLFLNGLTAGNPLDAPVPAVASPNIAVAP